MKNKRDPNTEKSRRNHNRRFHNRRFQIPKGHGKHPPGGKKNNSIERTQLNSRERKQGKWEPQPNRFASPTSQPARLSSRGQPSSTFQERFVSAQEVNIILSNTIKRFHSGKKCREGATDRHIGPERSHIIHKIPKEGVSSRGSVTARKMKSEVRREREWKKGVGILSKNNTTRKEFHFYRSAYTYFGQ